MSKPRRLDAKQAKIADRLFHQALAYRVKGADLEDELWEAVKAAEKVAKKAAKKEAA